MWRTRQSARAKMEQLAATAPSTCRVVRLRSNRDTERFLADIQANPGSSQACAPARR